MYIIWWNFLEKINKKYNGSFFCVDYIFFMFYSIKWFKNLIFKIYNEIVDDGFRMFGLNFLI